MSWRPPTGPAYLAIMAGGAIGAAARVWLSSLVASRIGEAFPWGTILCNVLGCFVIGVFWAFTGVNGTFVVPLIVRQAIVLGVIGGFTTFSSFSLQTMILLSTGQWPQAIGNVIFSVMACLGATWAGIAMASCVQSHI